MDIDILIMSATVVTMNPMRDILTNGAIGIQGNRIAFIGTTDEAESLNAERLIDARGDIVLPGFVNCHTHSIQSLLRGGLSQDKSLVDWLVNVLLPGLSGFSGEDARVGARLYAMESIRSGITTFLDNADASQSEDVARATLDTYKELGLRVIYGRMFLDQMPTLPGDYMSSVSKKDGERAFQRDFLEDIPEALDKIRKLIQEYHRGSNGRIEVWPAPAMPMYVSEEGLLKCHDLAVELNTGITIHLSESHMEHLAHQMSPVEYLANIGFLSNRLVAAHCVHTSSRDLRILKQHGVKIATLPVSNMYLGSGVAPVPDMLSHNIAVGLGTDDANCNDSVSMLSDMKFLALIHRGLHNDAAVLTSERVLEIATIDGARVLGLENEIGSLELGKKADIVVIDRNVPQMTPLHHVPAALVYQAYGSEVNTVIVDGHVLLENGLLSFISKEEESSFYELAQRTSKIVAERAKISVNRDWHSLNF